VRRREEPSGWKVALFWEVRGREGMWRVCRRGEVWPSI
jgi:hypothetical protein